MDIRHSARAIILNDKGQVLLFKFTFRHDHKEKVYWVTPGGGLEDCESHEDALKRELYEETGIKLESAGSWLWTREVPICGKKRFISHERIFLVRVEDSDVSILNLSQNEVGTLIDFKWWSSDDILASEEDFSPPSIGNIVRQINSGLIPVSPVLID